LLSLAKNLSYGSRNKGAPIESGSAIVAFYLLVFAMSVGESLILLGRNPEKQEYFLEAYS
jgi:hypothetical protein